MGNKTDPLIRHMRRWQHCERCAIGEIAFNHVFFRGAYPWNVLFVGEAPGVTEDIEGKPFVGRAGKILSGWLAVLDEFNGVCWAITNVVACRPTDTLGGKNRKPRLDEVGMCSDRLNEFMQLCPNAFVIALGKVAESLVWYDHATFHPAYVGYNGGKGSELDSHVKRRLRKWAAEHFDER